MSAPINDNFATASVITGDSGFTTGTTLNATTQSGEPNIIGEGKTTWFAWTPSKTDAFSFTTLFNAAIGQSESLHNTALQAFALNNPFTDPTDITNLVEVSYLPLTHNKWHADYNRGAKINFTATASNDYWIRVDSVEMNSSSSQGPFGLTWGGYSNAFYNDCGGCAPKFGVGLKCLGTYEISDVTLPPYNTVIASTGPAYIEIDYCSGCFKCQPIEESWTVQFDVVESGSLGGPTIYFAYNSGSTVVSESLGGSADDTFDTFAECQAAFLCAGNKINTTGGDLILKFIDDPWLDNTNNNSTGGNPTFGVYTIDPVLRVTSACASWLTIGSVVSVDISILNETSGFWDIVYASFSGDITTTTPTRFSMGSNSTAGITVTGTCSHTQIAPTLNLTSPYFSGTISIPINLSPILQIDNPGLGTASFCFSLPIQLVNTYIHNRGYFFVYPTASISMSNNCWMVSNSGCHTSSFENFTFEMECGAVRPIPGIQFANTSSVPVTASLVFHLFDTTDDYGNITFPGFHI